jgi:Leucine-rich repeat (LRR) protein
LENLQGLTQLSILWLDHTAVTDAGLEHLKGLTQLQTLDLSGTNVTDEGVKKLQQALPKCQIVR